MTLKLHLVKKFILVSHVNYLFNTHRLYILYVIGKRNSIVMANYAQYTIIKLDIFILTVAFLLVIAPIQRIN